MHKRIIVLIIAQSVLFACKKPKLADYEFRTEYVVTTHTALYNPPSVTYRDTSYKVVFSEVRELTYSGVHSLDFKGVKFHKEGNRITRIIERPFSRYTAGSSLGETLKYSGEIETSSFMHGLFTGESHFSGYMTTSTSTYSGTFSIKRK